MNDIEEQFILSGFDDIDLKMFKMFMLLYADDIATFSNTAEELQYGLNLLSEYCAKWKLKGNVLKSKILIFSAGGLLPRNLSFSYEGEVLEIVKNLNTGASCLKRAGHSQRHKIHLPDKPKRPFVN